MADDHRDRYSYGECRCCLAKGKHRDILQEYHFHGAREVYRDMFKETFNLTLSKAPHLSLLCSGCITRLRDASALRAQAARAELTLTGRDQQMLFVEVSTHESLQIELRPEVTVKVELAEDEHNSDAEFISADFDGEMSLESQRPDPELNENDPEQKIPLTANGDETAVPENMVVLIKHRENIESILAHSNATPIRDCLNVGYVCVYCPEHYKEPAQLKKHTLAVHTTEKYVVKHVRRHSVKLDITGLKCSICETEIGELEAMMHHLKLKHKKPMHFDIDNHVIPYKFEKGGLKCVKCGMSYNNFKNLSVHMIDVHFRNYKCQKCPRGFVNKSSLLSHLTRHKRGEAACDFCDKIFANQKRKTEHERLRHKPKGKPIKCKLRPYRCTEAGCDRKFTAKSELQNHIVTHKSTVFSCEICPKKYDSSQKLHKHMFIHNEKRRPKARSSKRKDSC